MDKIERRQELGLLQPLPIPEKPWISLSMEFILGFPDVKGMKSILVVVDRFLKYAVFLAAPHPCSADQAVELFFSRVVKFFEIFTDVVCDRDSRFTDKF